MKKLIVFGLLYSTLLIIAFRYQEQLLNWIDQTDYSLLPLMFLLSIIFSIIPIVPYAVFAGLMGAKYEVLVGASINWVGSVVASIFFFMLVRYFFTDVFNKYIRRFDKVEKFDQIIGRNGFIAVLFSRLLPIVPTPVINIYSGVSSIRFSHYFAATAIGQIPNVIVYAYVGSQLFSSIQSTLFGIFIYISFLAIVFAVYYWWYKSSGVKV